MKLRTLLGAAALAASLHFSPAANAAVGQVTFNEPFYGGLCREVYIYYPSSNSTYIYYISLKNFIDVAYNKLRRLSEC